MYNLELTANKVGFCLYTLFLLVSLAFLQSPQGSMEVGVFAYMTVVCLTCEHVHTHSVHTVG